jgi:DNA-binding IclR family transcriptional regulator
MQLAKDGAGQETQPIQSLDRGLIILEAVANSTTPVSLSDLTAVLGIDRSSVYRLAHTLKRRGFLSHPGGWKNYILGPALWRLLHHYDWGTMLIRISREHLKQLAGETNETAHLAIREGTQGYASDDGEMQEGVRCVAAPIRAENGLVVGSIGISAPAIRFPKDRYPVCGEQVLAVAQAISAQLKIPAQN